MAIPLVAAFLVGTPAAGQSVGDDLEWGLEAVWFIWSSPARLQSSDLAPIGALVAGTAGALLIDDDVADWLRAHERSPLVRAVSVFGEDSPLNLVGRSFMLQTLSAVMYGIGHASDSRDLREAALGCAVSNVSTTLSRYAFANLLGRLRPEYGRGPFVIEPLAFGDWSMRSFFAGHAANIMTCASFWNHRFDLGVAEPLIWGVAGGIGTARMVDEAHWLSDTVIGLVYGYAIGKAVASRSRARWDRTASVDPIIRVGWQIRF